ncbi:MAG TPA: PorP/SprF family type IX secretion system membrane protein [Bacteroidales bacterium]|nr:PorP/SprF family type IX secretion system membrane protein [Bacteroidales bacterium]
MKRRYIVSILLFLGILGIVPVADGQDMNYSQYFSSPLYYNPAFTGVNTGIRARFLYRDQWPSLPIPFKSYYFSADLGDRNLPGSGGIGILVNQDTPGVGLINNFGAALTIGVRIPVTSYMVTQLGVKAGIMQRRINWDDLVFASQLDPKYGNVYTSIFDSPDANKRVMPDFGVGGLLQFINPSGNISGNIGFSVDHIFKPDVSFLSTGSSPYPRKWVGQFDLIFTTGPMGSSMMSRSFDEPLRINIGGIYQNQASLNSLQIGLNLLKYNIYLGGWYKSTMTGVVNSSMVLVAGYKYNFYEDMNLKFMYSYDLQISGALQGTGGAHEISLILEFDKLSIFGGGGGGGYLPGSASRRNGGPMECPTFY